jgi:sulfate transport system permease protein
MQKIHNDPIWVKVLLTGIAIAFLLAIILIPVSVVFVEAFSKGWHVYFSNILSEDTLFAVELTLIIALVAVPLNLFFGIMASWAITKYEFRGKQILITLIDLPFSISPVVVGLMYILLLGSHSVIGGFLENNGIKIIFHLTGLIIVSIFVTFPFVARELIPLMQEQGKDEEEASILLGAGGLKTFFKITLPNIKWALLYGVLLCNARAMGEFGAVSVVSGHIKGQTNSLPLHVEMLYNEYNFSASFAAASILTLLALITLLLKNLVEKKTAKKN